MHSVVAEHGHNKHNGWLYKIHFTKKGRIVMRTMRHVKLTPIHQNSTYKTQW